MERDLNSLLATIEDLRQRLNRFTARSSLSEPDVLAVSQQLDHLLNEFDRRPGSPRKKSGVTPGRDPLPEILPAGNPAPLPDDPARLRRSKTR